MFCDLVGSTSLAAKLDPEDWRNLVNAYLDEASEAVTGLGGHVLKKLGDGLMALFGYPKAQENDAERGRAGGACDPAGPFRPQRQERSIGHTRAFRPHRHRVRLCRGRRGGAVPRRRAKPRRAGAGCSRTLARCSSTLNVQRQIAGLFVWPHLDIPTATLDAPELTSDELRSRQLAAMVTWLLAGAYAQPLVLAFEDPLGRPDLARLAQDAGRTRRDSRS